VTIVISTLAFIHYAWITWAGTLLTSTNAAFRLMALMLFGMLLIALLSMYYTVLEAQMLALREAKRERGW